MGDNAGTSLDYQSPDWVAQQLGIDRQTVYKYLHEGTLPALKLGRKWLISASRLEQVLADREREQTEERRSAVSFFQQTLISERFGPDARAVVDAARQEAHALQHNYLGQEHLLLAITASAECAGARLLTRAGGDCERVREAIELVIGPGDPPEGAESEERWFTPRAQRSVELAFEAAGEDVVDSSHLLLGILTEGEGIGAAILSRLGVTTESATAAM